MGKQSREKRERLALRSLGGGGMEERKPELLSSPEKAYLFIIRWGTYLILFTPLIINTRFFFPFVTPKTIFFRIVLEIILAAYIFLVMTNRRWRPRINALTIVLALFLGIFILASFTGVNLERSFWSTYERMTGILTMLHLFAFFIILSSVFKRREDWEKILGVSIIVGVFLSLYILMSDQISSRGGGTIGNTSFMAAYLLFDVFFAIILFLFKRGWWQIFSGISLLIMLPVFLTSSARGAVVSFWIGLFLLFLGYLIFSQRKKLKRAALAIILVLIVFGVILAIFQPPFVKDRTETTLMAMESRFVVWEKGWKGFQERPILGWGPENFNNVFLKYFNPCVFLAECGGEVWFDRVHNIVLDTLVTTGLVGLLSYLAIFAVAIYGLLKTLPKVMDPVRSSLETRNNLDFSERSGKYSTSNGVKRKSIFIPLGLVVILVAYFAQNLLVFDMINTYLLFFLVLAFASFLIEKEKEEIEVRSKSINHLLASSVVIVMVFVLWIGNIQPIMANYYIIKTVGSRDVTEASAAFKKSLTGWMDKYEAREYFSQKMTKSVYQSIPEESKGAFQKAFDLAETEMEKSIKQNSLDFRPHLFLGQLYNSSYRLSGNKEKLEKSKQVLEKAIQLSPTNQQGYWHLAETEIAQGRTEETISLLQKAVELEPRIGLSNWYLAMAYKIAGKYELALEEVFKAEQNDFHWKDNEDKMQQVVQIYQALGPESSALTDYDNSVIELYSKIVELNPTNVEAWFQMAVAYANLAQYEKAREAAQKVAEIDPDLSSKIDEFLESLPR